MSFAAEPFGLFVDDLVSALTGGVSTNVSRMASAKGTNIACAQYRTTTTSAHPAKVTQGFTLVAVSFIVVWERSIGRQVSQRAPSQSTELSAGAMCSTAQRQSSRHGRLVRQGARHDVEGQARNRAERGRAVSQRQLAGQ